MEKRESGTLHNSLMVIVPHQDDEILLCAGILYEAARRKIPATVVMVTNGDYGSSDLTIGRSRLKETLAGLAMLGIDAGDVEFLGYADTGMPKAESFLSALYEETDGRRLHKSHCSEETYGLDEKDEYHKKRWGTHAPYDRDHLAADLYGVIEEYRPAMIFTTSEFDTHGDHSALYLFVRDILAEMKEKADAEGNELPRLFSGIVHSPAGDENWPVRTREVGAYTEPEQSCVVSRFRWEDRISFPVPECMRTEKRTENLKYRALSRHVTALKPDAVDFLYAFIKNEELFWKIYY